MRGASRASSRKPIAILRDQRDSRPSYRGIVAPVGGKGVEQLLTVWASDWDLIREGHYGQRS